PRGSDRLRRRNSLGVRGPHLCTPVLATPQQAVERSRNLYKKAKTCAPMSQDGGPAQPPRPPSQQQQQAADAADGGGLGGSPAAVVTETSVDFSGVGRRTAGEDSPVEASVGSSPADSTESMGDDSNAPVLLYPPRG
ncbi:unnamed protein product, partial [Ectocarpus sp. 13 AM-2016]